MVLISKYGKVLHTQLQVVIRLVLCSQDLFVRCLSIRNYKVTYNPQLISTLRMKGFWLHKTALVPNVSVKYTGKGRYMIYFTIQPHQAAML